MTTQDIYQEIRPYNDDEVPAAIERLISDDEFITAILHYKFPSASKFLFWLLAPLLRCKLRRSLSKITTIEDVQLNVATYLNKTVKKTTNGITYTGLDKLDPNQAYLFVSNHRDIAMDPALMNWVLYNNKMQTVRIAIGDNLLKKACSTELMKLNKSFIVKRSAKAPRQMLKALGQLSAYIKHSLETNNSIWIAQKEGRAKDGNDFTDPAILKMFHVEGRKRKESFPDYMNSLKIVPVSISYENDPLDVQKAKELNAVATLGSYEKGEFEDIDSIIKGIIGNKKRIHIHFGDVVTSAPESADLLAQEMDQQITKNYHLFPINYAAANVDSDTVTKEVKQELETKLEQLSLQEQPYLRALYANPVKNAQ
ncbi:1-acyl-sn-glycerol-3-phosphate acyltransferase [Aliivibrio sp. S3MY1]|uniref:1-acyl-sn-glycerol-3-phosphate acyltransferase n=1 Tax=unclassified Aliivibrio TaxID=2645654 RepID=UPI0023796949|nr:MULTISPECIES: 1-acyl-sn-glycerol-3-phosphate acyltransferase [unclassified Aliivibrio]MDD9197234.1 1-acyl-sn-glycerol-3-phosphate acyltransferase [Aliivibrio sp. S3MY1]MDD9200416.1 1-acyl-sn-glycerol-3-phosphate acyltransferase [Aliivibrio sp. S2MY1]